VGIEIPANHIHSQWDLKETRKRLKGQARARDMSGSLSLTSLIDVFSVIIIFLIQSFSVQGEIILANPAISLPQAYHASMLDRSPIVTITPEKVTIEGLPVGDNTSIEKKIEETDWDLPLLRERLEAYKSFAKSEFPDTVFPAEIIVQADSGLNFVYLKRVMYSLSKLGFTGVNLAVRGEAKPRPTDESTESNQDAVDKK
jgi:biopolymer transport protein ExbD